MTKFSIRSLIAIHVALLVIWSSWARGGSSPAFFGALPWLTLALIVITCLLPPRKRGESSTSALVSLLLRVVKDPVFYIGGALTFYLFLQWYNSPSAPIESFLDPIDSRWKFPDPPNKGMPFSPSRGDGVQFLIWFSTIWAALLVVRNAMGPRLKFLLLRILVINGALLAILGILQSITGSDKIYWYTPVRVYFFSSFGYPNHAGEFFFLMSALNIGLLLRDLYNNAPIKQTILWTTTLIFNIVGTFGSLCRASIAMEIVLLVFAAIYGAIILHGRLSRAGSILVLVLGLILGGVGVKQFISNAALLGEVKTINADSISSVYKSDRKILSEIAIDIWKDYPWTGVGGWGFRYYAPIYRQEVYADVNNELTDTTDPIAARNAEIRGVFSNRGTANVHNDTVQFLCEHGMIGFGLMVALVLALLVSFILQLSKMERSVDSLTGSKQSLIKSISPVIVMSFAGLIAIVVHSTLDLPFRSIAVLLSWFLILATLPDFIHRRD